MCEISSLLQNGDWLSCLRYLRVKLEILDVQKSHLPQMPVSSMARFIAL